MSDLQVLPVAQMLLDCLTAAVQANPDVPASISFRMGDQVNHDLGPDVDECCGGLAYVSMGSVVPSAQAPDPDVIRQASSTCSPPSWIVLLRAGIIRCVPVSDDQGNPPTNAEWTASFVQSANDSQALRKAACCFRSCVVTSNDPGLFGMSMVIDSQELGPLSGGCVERFFTARFQIPNKDCCDCCNC